MTTINGRTPEEIRKGLEYYAETDLAKKLNACKQGLKYWYAEDVAADALAYIQQLEDGIKLLRAYNKGTLQKIVQLERERDAAVADMNELMQLAQFCRHCKHLTEDGDCTFDSAAHIWQPWCWQWRGVQEVE